MACERVAVPGGGVAIVCGVRRHKQCKCGRKATLECDWKVPSRRSGTCDKPICERCTTRPAPGKDLCPAHAVAFEQWKGKERAMTDEQIKHMTSRFLSWKLPESFNPDGGISAERPNYAPNVAWEPTGTNLLDYSQAEAMVRHMVEGLPKA